jgi:hypothetical protein
MEMNIFSNLGAKGSQNDRCEFRAFYKPPRNGSYCLLDYPVPHEKATPDWCPAGSVTPNQHPLDRHGQHHGKERGREKGGDEV